ncbi:MAG TPA: hypothetical protein VMP03_13000, partial [Methylomirabilota bacterium]|nr:hypothetical protein [Methylomirabilota bacterium]
ELRAGRTAEAIATLEEAFDAAEQANMPHFMTYASALAAVAHARRGDPGARDDLVDALRSARESADRWIEIEVLLGLAEIDGEERPRWLEEAFAVAAAANYGSLSTLVAEAIADQETPARLRVV